MTEITNIVPIQPNPEDGEVVDTGTNIEVEEVSNEEYCKRLAADAINFLEVEFKSQITCQDVFWGLIHEESGKRTKTPPQVSTEPYPEDIAKSFLEELVPWGKYAGQKISTVLKKDKPALEAMAANPLLFQLRLRRLLACDLDTITKTSKSSPRKRKK